MKGVFVIYEVGVVPDWGEHTGFQLCVCNLHSFPPGGQGGRNKWVFVAVMTFECNSDKREVREFNIVAV